MWFLCLQIILFVAGAFGLLTGKLALTEHLKLEGKRARITGGLLLLPGGLPVVYGVVFTAIAIASGHARDFRPNAAALDVPSTIGAIALVIAYVYLTRPKPAVGG